MRYRLSFRELFSLKKKSNADKVEKYLERCFQHPVVGISSILRDFTSVQREEDALLTSQYTTITHPSVKADTNKKNVGQCSTSAALTPSPSPPAPPILPPPVTSPVRPVSHQSPSPPNTLSLSKPLPPIVIPPVTLNDYDLLQILGKGCMGKVNCHVVYLSVLSPS